MAILHLINALVDFFIAVITHDKCDVRKGSVYGSRLRLESIVAGKPRQQELEVAGHIASTIKEERCMLHLTHFLLLILSGTSTRRMMLSKFGVSLPAQLD